MSLNANGANAGELESSPTSGVVENKVLFFFNLLLFLSLLLSYDDNDNDDDDHLHHNHYHYHHHYNSIISVTNMLLRFMVLVILFLVCT